MSIEKSKNPHWLNVAVIAAGILWGAAGVLSVIPAGIVVLFFDNPSPDWNANYLFIFSVISFPIVCIGSSLAAFFLRNRHGKPALFACLLPILPIILIFAGSARMNLASCGKFDCRVPSMQEQGGSTQLGQCVSPAPDGGDGLETTGCGVLEAGVSATGNIQSTSEAHNWQFSVQTSGRITITVEHQGNSCSQISILDSREGVIERFTDGNEGGQCLGGDPGMTTTSYFRFDPPDKGTYTLRITAPDAPGAYWLKITQE